MLLCNFSIAFVRTLLIILEVLFELAMYTLERLLRLDANTSCFILLF